MGELFIFKKFLGKDIAWQVAEWIFTNYPGKWSIAVMQKNIIACKFWHKVVSRIAPSKFTQIFKTVKELRTLENPESYDAMHIFTFEINSKK